MGYHRQLPTVRVHDETNRACARDRGRTAVTRRHQVVAGALDDGAGHDHRRRVALGARDRRVLGDEELLPFLRRGVEAERERLVGLQRALEDAAAAQREQRVTRDPLLELMRAEARALKKATGLDLLPTLIEDGRRVLLFSQFTEMLGFIELELARLKLPYLKLTGETKDRSAVVAQFQQGDILYPGFAQFL